MTPLVFGLGTTELLIILAVVLLLFGGSRLAGLGKSSGKAIREFKEETRAIKDQEAQQREGRTTATTDTSDNPGTTTPGSQVHDAEIIDSDDRRPRS